MALEKYGAMPLSGVSPIVPTAADDPGIIEAFGTEFGQGILRGFLNVGGGLVGTAEYLIPGRQESLIRAKENIESVKADYSQDYNNWAGWAGRVLGEALPYMGSAMVGGYAGGAVAGGIAGIGTAGLTGQAAIGAGIGITAAKTVGALLGAASVGFSVEGQGAYDEAIASGASEDEANAERLIVGTINAAIEASQISRLMKFHKSGAGSLKSFIRNVRDGAWDLVKGDAKRFTGQVLQTALEEGIEEAAQEGVAISIPGMLRGELPRKPNGMVDWAAIADRVGGAFAGGAFAGGVLGGAGALVGAAPEIGRPSNVDIDAAIESINKRDIPIADKELYIAKLNELRGAITQDQITDTPIETEELSPTVYHGTTKEFETFTIPAGQGNLLYGPGFYFTEDSDVASGYSQAAYGQYQPGSNIRPAKIRKGRVFDIETNTVPKDKFISSLKNVTSNINSVLQNVFAGDSGAKVSPQTAKHISDLSNQSVIDSHPIPKEWGDELTFGNMKNYIRSSAAKITMGDLLIDCPDINSTSLTNYILRDLGFNTIKHEGGKIMGDKRHQVWIALDSNQIESLYSKIPANEIPALQRQWEQQLVESIKGIDKELRKEHRAKIKKETGRKVAEVRDILADPSFKNPQLAFAVAKAKLEGEMGLRFDPLQFDDRQVQYFYQRVRTSPLSTFEKINAQEGLNNLFVPNENGQIKLPEPNQIKLLEQVFGPKLAKALFDLRGDTKTLTYRISDTLNIPRAFLASYDMSAAGRQGLMLLPIAPKQWIQAVGRGYKAWTSEQYADFQRLRIESHRLFPKYKELGGFLSDVGGLTQGEEIFSGDFAQKIPGIRASERAYVTTLNSLRFDTFVKYFDKWQGAGKSNADYKALVGFILHSTGRGDIKGLEKYSHTLNAAFFAPRLQAGRIQSVTDLFKGMGEEIKEVGFDPRKFSETRKLIARDLISFFGAGVGALWLASLIKGVKVERDPRSSDFGKIRFGNTRIDFWGGYSQIARLVAQLWAAESKGADTGRIMPVERGQVVWRFIQSKLSPAAGLSVDLLRGETFLGKQLEMEPDVIAGQFYERFTPLFIQDVVDTLRFQGLTGAGIVTPLAFHGIGAMTYPVRASSEAARLKDIEANKTFGIGWDELSATAQEALRERVPMIELSERQAQIEREDFTMVAKRLEEQHYVMQDIIGKLPKPVKQDIKDYDVYIPGLSRYVSNGWYLNDKRYKDYQAQVKRGLSLYLTKLRGMSMWGAIPNEMKATLIEEVARAVKKQARDRLLADATIQDFRRLQKP